MILNKIFFCIFYGFVWTITLLPLKVLYVFSDIIFVILYYIISYRKDIIQNNLKNSFPQKTIQEINLIHKLYIRHLSDIIIETLKIIHLSEYKTLKIVHFKNRDLIHNLYNNNKSIILVMGHYGNWELLIGFPLLIKYICIAIYKPLKNIYFDSFINCLRGKFGTKMAAMNQILKTILEYQQKKILTVTLFIADQIPTKNEIQYWTNFLNQDTAVFLGIEKIAKKSNFAVVFLNMNKIRRGSYEVEFNLITDEPDNTPEYYITDRHVRLLEQQIIKNPQYWMWSHRRWKHKRNL